MSLETKPNWCWQFSVFFLRILTCPIRFGQSNTIWSFYCWERRCWSHLILCSELCRRWRTNFDKVQAVTNKKRMAGVGGGTAEDSNSQSSLDLQNWECPSIASNETRTCSEKEDHDNESCKQGEPLITKDTHLEHVAVHISHGVTGQTTLMSSDKYSSTFRHCHDSMASQ